MVRSWNEPPISCARRGHPVRSEVCDVSDAARVDDLVSRIEREDGPIEVLVCVAGVVQVGPLRALGRQHFTDAVDIMLWGPVNTALAVVPAMRGAAVGGSASSPRSAG